MSDPEATLERLLAESDRDLVPADGWIWCEYWSSTPFQHPDDCAGCPGPHRTVLLGPTVGASDDE